MMSDGPHIFCASINFQKLDDTSDHVLSEADLDSSAASIEAIKESIGFAVDQVAIIKKCNAIMIVITYVKDYTDDFLKGRITAAWDELVKKDIEKSHRYIKYYEDVAAIKYLCECALSIHSVTPGDSQVFSQVHGALVSAETVQTSNIHMFATIAKWIKKVAVEAKLKTDLFNGNLSLERIATELIDDKQLNKADLTATVVGSGRTGQLVIKILSDELGIKVAVANRTKDKSSKIASKYKRVEVVEFDDYVSIAGADCIIIALSYNDDTKKYIKNIVTHINKSSTDSTLIVDLSSPALVDRSVVKNAKVFNIQDISEIAQHNANLRKAELDKARKIIDQSIKTVSKLLFEEFGKISNERQKKSHTHRVGQSAIDILEARQSILNNIRSFFSKKGFMEVITPYIVGVSSDPPRVDKGGQFSVEWPNGSTAFLRQSNQLYKQMLVASGVPKIYEIGPFWRAEDDISYRHLLESIGLDVEFSNPGNLQDVYELAYETILNAFSAVKPGRHKADNSKLSLPPKKNVPVIKYSQAIEMLRSHGFNIKYGEDLGLVGESKIGQVIKKQHMSDAVIIKDYPDTIKKFYTKNKSGGETETFDVIIEGWELISGAIRETDRRKIEKSMLLSDVNSVDYGFYLSVIDGSVPHAGFCLGIDRLSAKILGKEMVSDAVAFPRTPNKLIP